MTRLLPPDLPPHVAVAEFDPASWSPLNPVRTRTSPADTLVSLLSARPDATFLALGGFPSDADEADAAIGYLNDEGFDAVLLRACAAEFGAPHTRVANYLLASRTPLPREVFATHRSDYRADLPACLRRRKYLLRPLAATETAPRAPTLGEAIRPLQGRPTRSQGPSLASRPYAPFNAPTTVFDAKGFKSHRVLDLDAPCPSLVRDAAANQRLYLSPLSGLPLNRLERAVIMGLPDDAGLPDGTKAWLDATGVGQGRTEWLGVLRAFGAIP